MLFAPSQLVSCVNVPVTNDQSPEPRESFTVSFVPRPREGFVVASPSMAVVTIIDDDGESKMNRDQFKEEGGRACHLRVSSLCS